VAGHREDEPLEVAVDQLFNEPITHQNLRSMLR
jgi:hypothetical protein